MPFIAAGFDGADGQCIATVLRGQGANDMRPMGDHDIQAFGLRAQVSGVLSLANLLEGALLNTRAAPA